MTMRPPALTTLMELLFINKAANMRRIPSLTYQMMMMMMIMEEL